MAGRGASQVTVLTLGLLFLAGLTHHQPWPLPDDPPRASSTPAFSLLRQYQLCSQWRPLLHLGTIPLFELIDRMKQQFDTHARYEKRRRPNYVQFRFDSLG